MRKRSEASRRPSYLRGGRADSLIGLRKQLMIGASLIDEVASEHFRSSGHSRDQRSPRFLSAIMLAPWRSCNAAAARTRVRAPKRSQATQARQTSTRSTSQISVNVSAFSPNPSSLVHRPGHVPPEKPY